MKKITVSALLMALASSAFAWPAENDRSWGLAVTDKAGTAAFVDLKSIALQNDGLVSYWELLKLAKPQPNFAMVEYLRVGQCGAGYTQIQASRVFDSNGILSASVSATSWPTKIDIGDAGEAGVLAYACANTKARLNSN